MDAYKWHLFSGAHAGIMNIFVYIYLVWKCWENCIFVTSCSNQLFEEHNLNLGEPTLYTMETSTIEPHFSRFAHNGIQPEDNNTMFATRETITSETSHYNRRQKVWHHLMQFIQHLTYTIYNDYYQVLWECKYFYRVLWTKFEPHKLQSWDIYGHESTCNVFNMPCRWETGIQTISLIWYSCDLQLCPIVRYFQNRQSDRESVWFEYIMCDIMSKCAL